MVRPHDEQLRVTSASLPTFGPFQLRPPAEAESSSLTVGQLLYPRVAVLIFVTRRNNEELIRGGGL